MSKETFPYESHTDTPVPEEVREAAKKQVKSPPRTPPPTWPRPSLGK